MKTAFLSGLTLSLTLAAILGAGPAGAQAQQGEAPAASAPASATRSLLKCWQGLASAATNYMKLAEGLNQELLRDKTAGAGKGPGLLIRAPFKVSAPALGTSGSWITLCVTITGAPGN